MYKRLGTVRLRRSNHPLLLGWLPSCDLCCVTVKKLTPEASVLSKEECCRIQELMDDRMITPRLFCIVLDSVYMCVCVGGGGGRGALSLAGWLSGSLCVSLCVCLCLSVCLSLSPPPPPPPPHTHTLTD